MAIKNYESVFILTPVLSDSQMKDAAKKFAQVLKDNGAKVTNEEQWGLRKLAYPIQNKNTGFYVYFEFEAEPTIINVLETEYRRDEKILRFLTTVLDKYAVEYNNKRRKGEFKKSAVKTEE
jgi:small subunit ribosomal protein S6